MNENRPWREPERFAAGDTLWFARRLPTYLPSAGWQLAGTVTAAGGQVAAQYVSAADNDVHEVKVPGFLLNAAAGAYVLSEEIVNAGLGVRHQIYYEDLLVAPDLADGAAAGPILTFPQKMIAALEDKALSLEMQALQETEQHRTRFLQEQRRDVLDRLKYWYEKRNNEVQWQRARNGQNPGNVQAAVFAIG